MGVVLVKKPPGTATVTKKLVDNKGKVAIAETETEEKVNVRNRSHPPRSLG